MYKTTVKTLLFLVLFGHCLSLVGQNNFYPNHLLIKFHPGTPPDSINELAQRYNAQFIWISFPSQMQLWEVNFSGNNTFGDIHEVVKNANSKGTVKSAGLDLLFDLSYFLDNPDFNMQKPDPLYVCEEHPYQLGGNINAIQDNLNVKIAFVDAGGPVGGNEGLSVNHPAVFSPYIIPGNAGIDFIEGDNVPNDQNGHGIHTAGIVALENNLGAEASMKFLFMRAFDQNGEGSIGDMIRGIDQAVQLGASVINLSCGYSREAYEPEENPPLKEVIDVARLHNVLIVAAAGNDKENNDEPDDPTYPASFDLDNIISVAAADCYGELAEFSNYGAESVDIAAPGVNILSTYLGGLWALKSGTSQAAPFVSYTAGLLSLMAPFDYQQVKCAILSGAEHVSGLNGKVRTAGILNIPDAIAVFSDCTDDDQLQRQAQTPSLRAEQLSYPNPFKDQIELVFKVFEYSEVTIQLMNATGAVLFSQREYLEMGPQKRTLVFPEHLPSGVYFLKIQQKGSGHTQKLIKL
ncbi:MAG: S8 family peptidase [Saprospiraceae bacterium]